MKPELISFKLCPFVQKAVLTLLYKDIEFSIQYIDLENPPEWFKSISPLGKVPLVRVGDSVLFESSVIVEYLNEQHGESLHPADPLQKAHNRSWMEFGNECLMNGFNLIVQADEAGFNEQRNAMLNKLNQLELQLDAGDYFNGDQLSLVDLSFAPFFQRLQYLDEASPGLIDSSRHPKVSGWADRLLGMPIMADSAVPEIKQLYTGMMKKRGGYLATLMD